MDMWIVPDVFRWLLLAGLFLIAGLVVARIMGGQILITDMLAERPGGTADLHRLQQLAVSLAVASGYLIAALARDPRQGLPDLPPVVLLGLAGSQASYLGGKYFTLRHARRNR